MIDLLRNQGAAMKTEEAVVFGHDLIKRVAARKEVRFARADDDVFEIILPVTEFLMLIVEQELHHGICIGPIGIGEQEGFFAAIDKLDERLHEMRITDDILGWIQEDFGFDRPVLMREVDPGPEILIDIVKSLKNLARIASHIINDFDIELGFAQGEEGVDSEKIVGFEAFGIIEF